MIETRAIVKFAELPKIGPFFRVYIEGYSLTSMFWKDGGYILQNDITHHLILFKEDGTLDGFDGGDGQIKRLASYMLANIEILKAMMKQCYGVTGVARKRWGKLSREEQGWTTY